MKLTGVYIISQILVIIYYLLYSYTFHMNNKNKILLTSIIATISSSISYLLLEAYTGMVMCFVAIIRNILFTKYKDNKISLIVIILLLIIGSIFTYKDIFSLFSALATLIYTYALWQSKVKSYKSYSIITNFLMIIYNFHIKSIFGLIFIIIAFISSVLGYLKELNRAKS